MKPRTASHLALTLLVAAGLGVSAGRTHASQDPPPARKKPSTSAKSGSSTAPHKSSAKKSTKKSGKRAPEASSRGKGQKAPTADRISEIQQALAKDGSYSGTPNGKWDDQTVGAMRKYQESHGLNPSGKVDARTLNQLGLGSQTAGVAAPMPPVSSSSTATPTKTVAKRQ
jgi:peptidoglycan hydrolase-like protein with peptidoglycan-binding domain